MPFIVLILLKYAKIFMAIKSQNHQNIDTSYEIRPKRKPLPCKLKEKIILMTGNAT